MQGSLEYDETNSPAGSMPADPLSRSPSVVSWPDTEPASASAPSQPRTPRTQSGIQFVDNLASCMALNSQQMGSLIDLQQIGADLPPALKPLLQMEQYVLGQIYRSFNDLEAKIDAIEGGEQTDGSVKKLLKKLENEHDQTFSMSKTQRTNARALAKELIIDPTRMSYHKLEDDLLEALRAREKEFGLKDVFDMPSKFQMLKRESNAIASGIRNMFRNYMNSSLVKKLDLKSLASTTRVSYARTGGVTYSLQAITCRLSILRRLIIENRHLEDLKEGEDEKSDDGPGNSDKANDDGPTRKRTRPEEAATATASSAGGRPAKGQDFFGLVDRWLEKMSDDKMWGKDMTKGKWKEFIEETVQLTLNGWKKPDTSTLKSGTTTPPSQHVSFLNQSSGGQPPVPMTPTSQTSNRPRMETISARNASPNGLQSPDVFHDTPSQNNGRNLESRATALNMIMNEGGSYTPGTSYQHISTPPLTPSPGIAQSGFQTANIRTSFDDAQIQYNDALKVEGQIVVLIDGMDECMEVAGGSEAFHELLVLLFQLASRKAFKTLPFLRFVIASRPGEPIHTAFTKPAKADNPPERPNTHHLRLDNSSSETTGDILKYLTIKLEEIFRKNHKFRELRKQEDAIPRLAESSSGLFIWATVVIRFLRLAQSRERLEAALDTTIPKDTSALDGLHELYGTVLGSVTANYRDETIKAHVRSIFGPVIAVGRVKAAQYAENWPKLTETVLRGLLEHVTEQVDDILSFLPRLGAVMDGVHSANTELTLLHKSFEDYLTDESRAEAPWYIDVRGHWMPKVARCCIQMVHSDVFSDIPEAASEVLLFAHSFWTSSFVEQLDSNHPFPSCELSRFFLEILQRGFLRWTHCIHNHHKHIGSSRDIFEIPYLGLAYATAKLEKLPEIVNEVIEVYLKHPSLLGILSLCTDLQYIFLCLCLYPEKTPTLRKYCLPQFSNIASGSRDFFTILDAIECITNDS
ncbi:hypothetical protein V5O48_011059, partial [Marasmius crinis-equi]